MEKETLDKSIWMGPLPTGYYGNEDEINKFLSEKQECGLVVDVRVRRGKNVPKRPYPNTYVFVNYAHENSIPRSLKVASNRAAVF